MTFILGFMCGAILGAVVTHLAYAWLNPPQEPESGPLWFRYKCPPCRGDCDQGRQCPAKEQA